MGLFIIGLIFYCLYFYIISINFKKNEVTSPLYLYIIVNLLLLLAVIVYIIMYDNLSSQLIYTSKNNFIKVFIVNLISITPLIIVYLFSSTPAKKNLQSFKHVFKKYRFYSFQAVTFIVFLLLTLNAIVPHLDVFITNPLLGRVLITESLDGLEWNLVKTIYIPFALLTIYLIFYDHKKFTFKVFAFGIILIILILSILLGSRWFPFSLLMLMGLYYNRKHEMLSFKKLFISSVLIIFSISILSGIRYYQSHNRSLFESNLLVINVITDQVLGINKQMAISMDYIQRPEFQKVFINNIIDKAIPTPIYYLLSGGNEKQLDETVGSHVARNTYMESSGGIRVGSTGEVYFAFGIIGLLLYQFIIAALLKILDYYYCKSNLVSNVVAMIFYINLYFTMLIGASYIFTTIKFSIFIYFITIIQTKKIKFK